MQITSTDIKERRSDGGCGSEDFGSVCAWNAVILVIVAIALFSAAGIYLFTPERLRFEAEPPQPDFAGIGFTHCRRYCQIIAIGGEQDNWFGSLHLRIAFLIGLFALAAFVWRDSDLNNPNPLLNLRLIVTERGLSTGLGFAIIFGAMLSWGVTCSAPVPSRDSNLQRDTDGGFFFVDGLAGVAGAYVTMNLPPRIALSYRILGALILFIVGNFAFVCLLTVDTPGSVICLVLILHGVSIGMLFRGVANLAFSQIDLRVISFGAAIYVFFRQLGTSIGVSGVLAWLDVRQTLHSSRLLDSEPPQPQNYGSNTDSGRPCFMATDLRSTVLLSAPIKSFLAW